MIGVVTASAPAFAQAAGARPKTMTDVLAASTAIDWRRLDPENTMYLDLPSGRVVIELAPAFAPTHVANVKALVREGYFDGLAVVRSQDNYVAQWADPDAADEKKRRPIAKAKRTLPAEFDVPIASVKPFTRLPDGDVYAPEVGFSGGFPVARDPKSSSGGGPELYAVTGHAPRHLDRNVTLLGRVVWGMDHLSSLPRGTAPLGYYEKAEERTPIRSARMAADLPDAERVPLEALRTDTATFAALVESRRNRRDDWFVRPAGKIELCNVPLVVRAVGSPGKK
jgi:peptidylprolyl isomerase